jgi:hypothetical protein
VPKRVIDFDAMWASDKLAACAEWSQTEYAWLYGLADCAGCFELTNLRVIWGRVAAIRRSFSIERLEQVLDEFQDKGLLFVWNESGKRYGHSTGSDVPGRLPPPSWRNRLERLAPAVPQELFVKYVAAHLVGVKNKSRCESLPDGTSAACGRELPNAKLATDELPAPLEFEAAGMRAEPVGLWRDERSANCSSARNISTCRPRPAKASRKPNEREWSRPEPLKARLEEPQAQDLDWGLDQEGNRERQIHTHAPQDQKSVCEANANSTDQEQKPFEENTKAKSEGHAKANPLQNGPTDTKTVTSNSQVAASAESLREIWQQERGALPELRALSPERAARCSERISHARNKGKDVAQFLADFREAVTRAAATPFLCGEGPAGWRANFDWLIANDTNYLKVIEGRYDAGAGISARAGTASSGGTGAWASHVVARDESVRREINAGAGPTSIQNSTRVRAGVIDRALHRE